MHVDAWDREISTSHCRKMHALEVHVHAYVFSPRLSFLVELLDILFTPLVCSFVLLIFYDLILSFENWC